MTVLRTVSTVGDLGLWRGGATPSKAVGAFWTRGSVPWVTPKDMADGTISGSQDMIADCALRLGRLTLHPPGSVAVVFRSGVLRHTFPVAIGAVPFTTNQDLKTLAPGAGIWPRFAFHTLSFLGPQVITRAVKTGTTVESVDLRTFLAMPIFLPLEEEQQCIAEILDAADEAIRKTEALVAKLKQMKAGLLHDLLTRGLDDDGQLRDPINHPEQFKDWLLWNIPANWGSRNIGSMAEIRYGVSDAVDQSLEYGIRTITLPCVSAQGDLSLKKELLALTAPVKVTDGPLRNGDLLFNWRNGSRDHSGKDRLFRRDRRVHAYRIPPAHTNQCRCLYFTILVVVFALSQGSPVLFGCKRPGKQYF